MAGRDFFDEVETLWPAAKRPRAAGVGHTKYVPLPTNTQHLPGALFVVTTSDVSTDVEDYGYYRNTPIQGIGYIIDNVIDAANQAGLSSLAIPLIGTGYANVRRTISDEEWGHLLRNAVTMVAIKKLQQALEDPKSTLRRAVIVVFSRSPQGPEEKNIWEAVTRFLGKAREQRDQEIESLIKALR